MLGDKPPTYENCNDLIMKNNLQKLVLFLFLLLVSAHDVHSSFEKIIEVGLFEVYEDTINTGCEQFLLNDVNEEYEGFMKSMNYIEYFKPVRIDERYYFNQIPGLKLYDASKNMVYFTGRMELLKSCALINCNDSSIYYFGGDTILFNNVIKNFLPEIIEKNLIKDLISLYLCSLSTKFSTYPLFLINDYENIWISYNLELDNDLAREHREKGEIGKVRQMMIFSEEEIDKDIAAVNRIIKNYSISSDDDSYVAEVYTWEELDGEIEFWRFKINNESFRILERKTVAKNFGPFKWWVR